MSKNKVEVIIGGTIYSLQGEESQEHIQKVARLIDSKVSSIQQANRGTALSTTKVYMLTALNITSELIKTEEDLNAYSLELEKCSAENLALKDRIKELTLELTKFKMQTQSTPIYPKKNDHTNRGR